MSGERVPEDRKETHFGIRREDVPRIFRLDRPSLLGLIADENMDEGKC